MAQTEIQESAQALFCALADYVQLKRDDLDKIFNVDTIPTYKAFKVNWDGTYPTYKVSDVFKKNTDTDVTQLKLIEDFLTKNLDWYKSSVLTAKTLILDIDKVVRNFKGIKKPKPTEIWFSRGDQEVMKNINSLFDVANETRKEMNRIEGHKKGVVFGDINKWNPADIYFATDVARKKIDKEVKQVSRTNGDGYLFSQLNTLISDLIEDGQLLPLSLKKQTKEVKLYPVNFDRQYELKQFADLKYVGLVKKFEKSQKGNLKTRDITVKYNPKDSKFKFQIKHDVSNAAFKVDIGGVEARGGGISSINIFSSLMALVDKLESSKLYRTFETGNKKFKESMKLWEKEYGKKPPPTKKGQKPTPLRQAYEDYRSEASALLVVNEFAPELSKWLESSQPKADKFVRIIHEYATSRTEDSGKFVIAK